jgi:hypothetical protein
VTCSDKAMKGCPSSPPCCSGDSCCMARQRPLLTAMGSTPACPQPLPLQLSSLLTDVLLSTTNRLLTSFYLLHNCTTQMHQAQARAPRPGAGCNAGVLTHQALGSHQSEAGSGCQGLPAAQALFLGRMGHFQESRRAVYAPGKLQGLKILVTVYSGHSEWQRAGVEN